MKRTVILALTFLALAFVFVLQSLHRHPPQVRGERFKTYAGMPPLMTVSFDYPETWKLVFAKSRNIEAATAQVIGPRDLQKRFSVSIAVIAKKRSGPADLDAEMNSVLEKNKGFAAFKTVKTASLQVGGRDARELIFNFDLGLPVDVKGAPPTVMTQGVVLVARGDVVYQINFIGTREQNEKYGAIFRRLLETFRFQ